MAEVPTLMEELMKYINEHDELSPLLKVGLWMHWCLLICPFGPMSSLIALVVACHLLYCADF